MSHNVLVVGANGGIGKAVLSRVLSDQRSIKVFAVSRDPLQINHECLESVTLDHSDASINAFMSEIKKRAIKFDEVYICTGTLHSLANDGVKLKPEKRLEDISFDALHEYFAVNTIVPALWLKYLINALHPAKSSIGIVSARVGSISDNRLGGWYGYRSSKAALNMMIKTAAVEYARRSPSTSLISYHPGTVDTALSKPFQANVRADKLFTPEFTAARFITICQTASSDQSPVYIDYDGNAIPW